MKDYRPRIIKACDAHDMATETLARLAPPNGDFALNDADGHKCSRQAVAPKLAAVLIPIIEHSSHPHVLLTRRAAHLNSHSGQVAFPGGKIEADDASPAAAALRETREEIGLAATYVQIAGCLDVYATGSGYHILPLIGFVSPGFELTPDAGEVAEIFEVPLAFLMDARNHQKHSGIWQGKRRHYYAMPYGEHYIWGATAGMIRNLFERGFQYDSKTAS